MKVNLNKKEDLDQIIDVIKKTCPHCAIRIAVIPISSLTKKEEIDIIYEVMQTKLATISP